MVIPKQGSLGLANQMARIVFAISQKPIVQMVFAQVHLWWFAFGCLYWGLYICQLISSELNNFKSGKAELWWDEPFELPDPPYLRESQAHLQTTNRPFDPRILHCFHILCRSQDMNNCPAVQTGASALKCVLPPPSFPSKNPTQSIPSVRP